MKIKVLLIAILIINFSEIKSQVSGTHVIESNKQISLPYNRLIQPAGIQIFFGDASRENHALDAVLSPDGKWLAVEERYSIVFISTSDNSVKYVLRNTENKDLGGGMNTYSGIIWRSVKNGMEVFWSAVGRGDRSYVVSARWDGEKAEFQRIFEYQTDPGSEMALPNEILIRKESRREYLYVVLNGNNKVIKQ